MTTETHRITEWNVIDHGIEASDYFQGHGIALTDYTHTATGIGDNPSEALDDAIEQLATAVDGIDWGVLEHDIRVQHPDFNDAAKVQAASVSAYYNRWDGEDCCHDEHPDCDHHYRVSIDLRIETG